jgi:hypothetical protein
MRTIDQVSIVMSSNLRVACIVLQWELEALNTIHFKFFYPQDCQNAHARQLTRIHSNRPTADAAVEK